MVIKKIALCMIEKLLTLTRSARLARWAKPGYFSDAVVPKLRTRRSTSTKFERSQVGLECWIFLFYFFRVQKGFLFGHIHAPCGLAHARHP